MNHLTIIGNLTAKPVLETRTVAGATVSVCHFNVAVNEGYGDRRKTQYFRVTAWRNLAENCANFLDKGKKVAVTGKVSVSMAQGTNGQVYANLEVDTTQGFVEFLSPKGETVEDMPEEDPAPAAEAAAATTVAPNAAAQNAQAELPW